VSFCQHAVEQLQPRLLQTDTCYVFTDASHEGYACVIACRDQEGRWRRLLGRGRTYKPYQKAWAIASSKIELLALQLGVEVMKYVIRVLQDAPDRCRPRRIVFGTDNETVLNRFQSGAFDAIADNWERKVSVAVNHALANSGACIFHVRGDLNPSDGPSRGLWRGECDNGAAVAWFRQERAVVPRRSSIRGEVAETQDSIVKLIGPIATRGSLQSLDERFLAERRDEETRQSWLKTYQDADPGLRSLVDKGTVVVSEEGFGSRDSGNPSLANGRGQPWFRPDWKTVYLFLSMSARDISGFLRRSQEGGMNISCRVWRGVSGDTCLHAVSASN
jgi:hypothetical protein